MNLDEKSRVWNPNCLERIGSTEWLSSAPEAQTVIKEVRLGRLGQSVREGIRISGLDLSLH